jgi:hypothetical protein
MDQFQECERWIEELTGFGSSYWVIPFDQNTDDESIDAIRQRYENKSVVRVGDRVNSSASYQTTKVLYRINAPANDRGALEKALWRTQP